MIDHLFCGLLVGFVPYYYHSHLGRVPILANELNFSTVTAISNPNLYLTKTRKKKKKLLPHMLLCLVGILFNSLGCNTGCVKGRCICQSRFEKFISFDSTKSSSHYFKRG
jgi:hypothetical protein